MISIIIAGGSGTRLWPLSTTDYPKHLLQLTGQRTLLQSAFDRASKIGQTVYVVTEASHAHHVREQLPELDDDHFLIEPGRRGTAHCILLALDYIARHHDRQEPIAFIHSDHHIRDIEGFARSFAVAGRVSSERREISLIGIEPTYAATGFGYIERDGVIDAERGVSLVESFKEKPDHDTAQKYVESGNYVWNAGYFVGSVDTFLDEIAASAPDLQTSYDKLSSIAEHGSDDYKQAYLELDNQVIDVALIEKARGLSVVAASFDWIDVGSFKDLHDTVSQDEAGNYITGDDVYAVDVENAYIRSDDSRPIAVIGLDNIVVVNTPEGILVARKDVSPLAVTKSPMSDRMAELLAEALDHFEICVISGGRFEQFQRQVIDRLHIEPHRLNRIHLMPTCGTRYYRFDELENEWQMQYAEDLTDDQKQDIIRVLEESARELGYWEENPAGEIIEDRGSQITFSALGQQASPDDKYNWDPDGSKKAALRDLAAQSLPDLEVRAGGTTSIDVTREGIDKAYGMAKLIDAIDINRDDILFFGDKLQEGGNDYPVKAFGVDCIAVEGWEDTAARIEAIVAVVK
ncbi:hypothetical protein B7Y94_06215 [Candidatus Saccharibacteria bacterium 32-49-12]|nr:MAG: hypothetical protein B7Y94_06215 [Candidatus Saccharibacteria bacterium 32-49-12]